MILEHTEATRGTHGHVNGLGNDGLKPVPEPRNTTQTTI